MHAPSLGLDFPPHGGHLYPACWTPVWSTLDTGIPFAGCLHGAHPTQVSSSRYLYVLIISGVYEVATCPSQNF